MDEPGKFRGGLPFSGFFGPPATNGWERADMSTHQPPDQRVCDGGRRQGARTHLLEGVPERESRAACGTRSRLGFVATWPITSSQRSLQLAACNRQPAARSLQDRPRTAVCSPPENATLAVLSRPRHHKPLFPFDLASLGPRPTFPDERDSQQLLSILSNIRVAKKTV